MRAAEKTATFRLYALIFRACVKGPRPNSPWLALGAKLKFVKTPQLFPYRLACVVTSLPLPFPLPRSLNPSIPVGLVFHPNHDRLQTPWSRAASERCGGGGWPRALPCTDPLCEPKLQFRAYLLLYSRCFCRASLQFKKKYPWKTCSLHCCRLLVALCGSKQNLLGVRPGDNFLAAARGNTLLEICTPDINIKQPNTRGIKNEYQEKIDQISIKYLVSAEYLKISA